MHTGRLFNKFYNSKTKTLLAFFTGRLLFERSLQYAYKNCDS